MRLVPLVLLAAAVVAACAEPVLRTVTDDVPAAVSSGSDVDALYCDSWRLSVETANAGVWRAVPARCGAFLRGYMEGDRYASDSAVAAADSLAFAAQAFASVEGGARPAWVFDVDETLLSNEPYYAVSGWGLQEFNETSFDEWVDVAKAPALPYSLKLYTELQGLGFHIILLTGRTEFQRNATEENLLFAGYRSWEKLILSWYKNLVPNDIFGVRDGSGLMNFKREILVINQYDLLLERQPSDVGKTAVQYKSERRAAVEAEGFKILGNSGDQWSDLIGLPMATRSFKLPNPMYFIS